MADGIAAEDIVVEGIVVEGIVVEGIVVEGIFSSFPFVIFYLIFNRVACMVYLMLDHFLYLFWD